MFWSFERKHNILDEHVIKLFYTIQVQNVHNKKCMSLHMFHLLEVAVCDFSESIQLLWLNLTFFRLPL